METGDACPLCGALDSRRHALLSCTSARCTWALAEPGLVTMMAENRETRAKNWLFAMRDTMDHSSFVSMAVSLWAIW